MGVLWIIGGVIVLFMLLGLCSGATQGSEEDYDRAIKERENHINYLKAHGEFARAAYEERELEREKRER